MEKSYVSYKVAVACLISQDDEPVSK